MSLTSGVKLGFGYSRPFRTRSAFQQLPHAMRIQKNTCQICRLCARPPCYRRAWRCLFFATAQRFPRTLYCMQFYEHQTVIATTAATNTSVSRCTLLAFIPRIYAPPCRSSTPSASVSLPYFFVLLRIFQLSLRIPIGWKISFFRSRHWKSITTDRCVLRCCRCHRRVPFFREISMSTPRSICIVAPVLTNACKTWKRRCDSCFHLNPNCWSDLWFAPRLASLHFSASSSFGSSCSALPGAVPLSIFKIFWG